MSILAPVAALVILLFAGGTVPPCFRGVGITADVYVASCGSRISPEANPIIGWQAALVICGIAWLVATVALIVHIVRIDARRLLRAGAAAALVAVGAAGIGFATGAQSRLRQGAEDAVLYGIAALTVAMIVALAWAALTARPSSES